MYSVHCTAHCTLYTVQYTVQCTVYQSCWTFTLYLLSDTKMGSKHWWTYPQLACATKVCKRQCHNKPHPQKLRSRVEWFLDKIVCTMHMSSFCKLIWDPKSKILFWSVAFSLGLTRSQTVLPVKLKSAHTQKKEHF